MADPAGEHAIKEHTMTKAELVEEVTRVTELPRKESEAVVETIFESIIAATRGSQACLGSLRFAYQLSSSGVASAIGSREARTIA